ncbi:unnamed protein product, partial [Sphenostylis stenocarpa]
MPASQPAMVLGVSGIIIPEIGCQLDCPLPSTRSCPGTNSDSSRARNSTIRNKFGAQNDTFKPEALCILATLRFHTSMVWLIHSGRHTVR